jgi:hypothetical protein
VSTNRLPGSAWSRSADVRLTLIPPRQSYQRLSNVSHPTRYAASCFSSNFSPSPGLVGSTNCPFSIAGVSS